MTKKSRTILFSICVFLFLIIASVSVLYSQGYRLDFANKKLTQTGGLYIKTNPKQARIYLDGKLEKKTDFLFGSGLIENLIPKKYKIKIEKDDYRSWEKTLEIKEKEVTEAKYIMLLPQDLEFKKLLENIENFWLSPDGKWLVLKEKDTKGWSLKIYDLTKSVKSQLIDEKTINKQGAQFINLDFSPDYPEIYIDIKIKEQVKTYTINYKENPATLSEKATTSVPTSVIAYKKSKNDIYYLDNLGYVYRADLSFAGGRKINDTPLTIVRDAKYNIETLAEKIFIKENQALYLFNLSTKSFEKFLDQEKDIKISPDQNKILIFSENELWILYLNNSYLGSPAEKEKKIFLTRFSEKIGDAFWLNNEYLIFTVGDKIKAVEIDDRDKINIYDLGNFPDPEMYFNKIDGKIYLLSESNIQASENILP